jgi:hypothetical protein
MTDKGGITVKFQANENGDPSAEECEWTKTQRHQ